MSEETACLDEFASASVATVWAVADAAGTDPLELPPLQHVIDTDALDQLYRGAGENGLEVRGAPELRFQYAGCTIEIDGETVTVQPAAARNGARRSRAVGRPG